MKTPLLKMLTSCLVIVLIAGLTFFSQSAQAQDKSTTAPDTLKAAKDNSSSFNDSVQFDDMEPIFYEATEDDAVEKTTEGGSFNFALYGGIAVVLVIVLVVLKKTAKKKPSKK